MLAWAQQVVADSAKRIELTVLSVDGAVPQWLSGVTRNQLPHLILLDLKLPKLDGLAVLRTLRSNIATREIPIVVYSGEYIQADVLMAYQVGTNSFVAKPDSPEMFADFLAEQLNYWLQPRQRELSLSVK